MPKCRHCKEHFYAEIAIGMHLMARRNRKPRRCSTPDEMKEEGYALYQGGWLTTEAQWTGKQSSQETEESNQ